MKRMSLLLSLSVLLCSRSVVNGDPQTQDQTPATPTFGQPHSQPEDSTPATAKIWASPQTVVAGETTYVVIEISIDEHWHIYWSYPGANGAPTELHVTAPENIEVGPIVFPRPKRFVEPEGDVYGYEQKAVFLVPLTINKDHHARKISIAIDAYWLVCRKICLLGDASQKVAIEVLAAGATPTPPDQQVESAKAAQPVDSKTVKGVDISFSDDVLKISGPLQGLEKADFFPNPMAGIEYGTPTIKTSKNLFKIDVPVEIELRNALGEDLKLRGLILLGDKPTDPSYSFSIPAKPTAKPDPHSSS